jgi:hypothetical protein
MINVYCTNDTSSTYHEIIQHVCYAFVHDTNRIHINFIDTIVNHYHPLSIPSSGYHHQQHHAQIITNQ